MEVWREFQLNWSQLLLPALYTDYVLVSTNSYNYANTIILSILLILSGHARALQVEWNQNLQEYLKYCS